jgi:hypothetical protein
MFPLNFPDPFRTPLTLNKHNQRQRVEQQVQPLVRSSTMSDIGGMRGLIRQLNRGSIGLIFDF